MFKRNDIQQWLAAAGLSLGALVLAGCEAQGDSTPDGVESSPLFPNDGTTPGTITDGGVVIPGNFICEGGAVGAATLTAANGLVGNQLNALLDSLGAGPLNTLLGSVQDPDNVIDRRLATFANFTLTLDLFGVLTSLDELVLLDDEVGAGRYAVFGVVFPRAVVEASLIDNVIVTTFLGDEFRETMVVDATQINLLGQSVTGPVAAFVGLKARQSFDSVAIRLAPAGLSANLGEALHVHELCLEGRFVSP